MLRIQLIAVLILCFSGCHSHRFLKMFKQKAEKILDATGGNTECAIDLKKLMAGVIFRKHWALSMIDASAKIQPGILTGNLYQYGNFDQCLNVSSEDSSIQGQYCTVLVLPSNTFKSDYTFLLDSKGITDYRGIKVSYQSADILRLIRVTYGICIPKSCSISNLQRIWNYLEHMFGISFRLQFFDFTCRYKGKPIDPLPMDKYVYVFFAFVCLILLLSTVYDCLIHRDTENDNVLMCFSVRSNVKQLFLDKGLEDSSLTCLNGIKVISMFWIIHGHRVVANLFAGSLNGFELYEWKSKFYNTYIIGASFAVDTFLALSGMLLMFTFLKLKQNNPEQPFSLLGFYFYRFLRLTPALLATVLFYMSILKLLSDGPLWPIVIKKIIMGCTDSWWATLLFLTNFIDLSFQCIEQSWYLAVDSQLYFISPIILLNITRRPKLVFTGMLLAGLVSALHTFIITVKYEYGALYFEGNKEYHEKIYQPTQIRLTAWLIGMVFGYLNYTYQKIQLPKIVNLTLWLISLSVMVYIQLIHVPLSVKEYNAIRAGLFNALTRPFWALSVSTVSYLCVTGHGGFINNFLSCFPFKILSRLTYSMYLTHLGAIAYLVASRRHPENFSTFKCIHDFFGDIFIITFVSAIMCISFEYPMIRIAKILFKRSTHPKQQTKSTNTDEMQEKKFIVSVMSVEKLKSRRNKHKLKIT